MHKAEEEIVEKLMLNDATKELLDEANEPLPKKIIIEKDNAGSVMHKQRRIRKGEKRLKKFR